MMKKYKYKDNGPRVASIRVIKKNIKTVIAALVRLLLSALAWMVVHLYKMSSLIQAVTKPIF